MYAIRSYYAADEALGDPGELEYEHIPALRELPRGAKRVQEALGVW